MKAVRLISTGILIAASCIVACKKNNNVAPPNNGSTKDSVIYSTDFNTDDGKWGTGENASTKAIIEGGYYTIANKDTANIDYYYPGVLFGVLTDKLAIESSIKVIGGNPKFAAFAGIAWNYRIGGQQLGVFGFYNDGYFEIFKYDAQGKFVQIKEATASQAIKKNDFNALRIEQRSGVLHYFINGTEVYSRNMDTSATNVPDRESLDITALYADPSAIASIDYFKAYKLK